MTAEEEALIAGVELERRTQAVEPLSGYTVLRARREFANQSNVGFMLTSTNRKLEPSLSFLPDDAYSGGRRLRHSIQPALQPPGLLGRLARRGLDRRHLAAAEQHRSRVSAARRRPRRVRSVANGAHGTCRLASRSARLAARRRGSAPITGSRRPASTSTISAFSAGPTSACASHWFQIRDNVPGRFTRSFFWQPQSVRRPGTSPAIVSSAAATSTCTGRGRTTTRPASASTSTAHRSAIASRGADQAFSAIPRSSAGTASAPTAAGAVSAYWNSSLESDRQGTTRAQHRPLGHLAPDDGQLGVDGLPLQHQQ